MIELTRTQARRYLLAYHGLLHRRPIAGLARVVDYIRRVGSIQYDPLSIVARNADLVLQSRFDRYTPAILERALYRSRMLIDGWDKVASIMPVEDWPYFRRQRDGQRGWADANHPELDEVFPDVLRRIEELGSASWTDVRFEKTIDWPWGSAEIGRAALQTMWSTGDLVIHHRVGTKKYYAPTRCHLPPSLLDAPEPNLSDDAYIDWRVERRIRSAGLLPNRGNDAWQIDGVKSAERTRSIERLVDQKKILRVHVQDMNPPLYVPASQEAEVTRNRKSPTKPVVCLIAPLDNLMWDRRLIEELFGFAYRWEVYTPPAKRKYGYYVLPVLYGDRFVARCEPVMHRKTGCLEIKGWWWEDKAPDLVQDTIGAGESDVAFAECFRSFAGFCAAKSMEFTTGITGFGSKSDIKTMSLDIKG